MRFVPIKFLKQLAFPGILLLVFLPLIGAIPEDKAEQPTSDECVYNAEIPAVEDWESLINFSDPFKGTADAPVTVIEFFDPNCPHCKALHPTMKALVEKNKDKAKFVFRPFLVFRKSVLQVEALYYAAQHNKFFEMMDLQFNLQRPGGSLSKEDLQQMAGDLGLDGEELGQILVDGRFVKTMASVQEAVANTGLKGVPGVLINGRFVKGTSRTVACMTQLIDEAAAGK